MNSERNPALEKLLRGISTDHIETVRDAWRGLLMLGDAVVPAVLDKLGTKAWVDKPRGPIGKYLGILLALLDEIDPKVFQQEIARLRSGKLHAFHRRTVEFMSHRCRDRVFAHVDPDIPVYISDEVGEPKQVFNNLARWVQTDGLELSGLTRIDVIAKHSHMDYLGRYNLYFSGIVLTWPNTPKRGLRLWWQRINGEFTFYHEVGHHACGHLEGGQIADQEEEADRYARKMLRRAHPILIGTGRALIFPFRPLLRRYFKKNLEHPPTSS